MNAQNTEQTPGARRFGPPIVIATAAIGGLALLGVGVTAAVAGVNERFSTVESTAMTNAAGVTEIDVEADRGDFVLVFADVAEARLDVEGGDRWSMERNGDELVVKSREGLNWGFDLCFGGCGVHQATLTLPLTLEGIDAELSLGAGSLSADGNFGDVWLDVGAGEAVLEGSANRIDAEISAGRMEAELADVRQASFQVSAGGGDVRLTGTAPSEVTASVSAGSLSIVLPDVAYAVSSDVSAGGLDNGLRTDPSSRNRVTVDVSAGSLALRPGA